jgi:hypothetical protein
MKPKDKALELFHKYARLWHASSDDVKQCAIIAVDEILDVLGGAGVYNFADTEVAAYWEDVRVNLEKMV